MSWVLTGVSPQILTTLAMALGGSVLLLYVIKVRRRRVEVPFRPVWQSVLREQQATSLWEKLKRWVSLLVQLLLLALVLLALGDPRPEEDDDEGRSVVLIVDTSASMNALDEEGARRRIDRAIEEARAILDQLGPRDEIMLVRMDGQLEPLTPFLADGALADELVRELEPSATAADVRDAVAFAVDSLARRPRGEVVIISDGAWPDVQRERFGVDIPPHVDLVWIPVGTRGDNVALTAFNVRRYPADRTAYEVYAQVRSYLDVPVTVELSLYGEGRLVEVETLTVPPEGAELRIYPEIPTSGQRLEARVRIVAGDAVDVFPDDDVAWALLPRARTPRVLLVTPGNLYVEAPFLLNESIDVDVIRPDAYVATNAGDPSEGYDLTVFDGVTPATADRGNFLYFAPFGEHSPWTVEADVVDPIIHSTRDNHPLLRWVDGLRDVNIARARRLQLGDDDEVIASAISGAPMIVARDDIRGRRAAIAFAPTDSDLPLRIAFPVLLINAIDWFTGADGNLVESYRTGETWFVPLDDRELTEVDVVAPDGTRFVAQAWEGAAAWYGDQTGFYRVEAPGGAFLVAGNLADADESRVAPADDLELGDVEIATAFTEGEVELALDPWLWLVVAAFGLLMLEWATWNRRVTV
ncbi:MAG: VWA domain-containing protein [Myxococcales bacterium]|nr:VWA domain-containing protein [Myxococcales bacterium]